MKQATNTTDSTPVLRVFCVGSLVVDEAARTVRSARRDVDLPPRVFDLFCVLLSEPRRVFRRDDLLTRVWKDAPGVGDGALSQAIAVLRRSLDDADARIIRTVSRVGYGIEENVTVTARVADLVAPGPDAEPPHQSADGTASMPAPLRSLPAASTEPPATDATPAGRNPRRPVARWFIAAVAALVVAGLGIWGWPGAWAPQTSTPIMLSLSVAGESQRAEVLRNGLDTLLNARFAFTCCAHTLSSEQAGVLDGVVSEVPDSPRQFVVHWSFSTSGQPIQQWDQAIDGARLVDAIDGLLLQLQGRGATPAEVDAAIEESALEAFADGLLAERDGDLGRARERLEAALAISPRMGLARARLAQVLELQGHKDLAVANARLALEALVPASATYLIARQNIHRMLGDHEAAARATELLVEMQPSVVEWRMLLARIQVSGNRLDEAEATLGALDPSTLAPLWRADWLRAAGSLDFLRGRYDRAVNRLQAAAALADAIGRHDIQAYASLWLAHAQWSNSAYANARESARAAELAARTAGDVELAFSAKAWRLTAAAALPAEVDDAEYVSLRAEAAMLGNADALYRANHAWVGALIGRYRYRQALDAQLALIADLETRGALDMRADAAKSAWSIAQFAGTAEELDRLAELIGAGGGEFPGPPAQRIAFMAAQAETHADFETARDLFAAAAKTGDGAAAANIALYDCRAARMALLAADIDGAASATERCERAIGSAQAEVIAGAASRLHGTKALLAAARGASDEAQQQLVLGRRSADGLPGIEAGWTRFELAMSAAFAGDATAALGSVDAELGAIALHDAPRLVALGQLARCIAGLRAGDRAPCDDIERHERWLTAGEREIAQHLLGSTAPLGVDGATWLRNWRPPRPGPAD